MCTNSLLPLYHTSVFNFPEWNMFWCSTVDQFSGESTPVILPLDEKQVSYCFIDTCGVPLMIMPLMCYIIAHSDYSRLEGGSSWHADWRYVLI